MNTLYVENVRKDFNEEYKCKSEYWIQTEFDENVLDFWHLGTCYYILKLKQDDG